DLFDQIASARPEKRVIARDLHEASPWDVLGEITAILDGHVSGPAAVEDQRGDLDDGQDMTYIDLHRPGRPGNRGAATGTETLCAEPERAKAFVTDQVGGGCRNADRSSAPIPFERLDDLRLHLRRNTIGVIGSTCAPGIRVHQDE